MSLKPYSATQNRERERELFVSLNSNCKKCNDKEALIRDEVSERERTIERERVVKNCGNKFVVNHYH